MLKSPGFCIKIIAFEKESAIVRSQHPEREMTAKTDLIKAHRRAGGRCPENTILALDDAPLPAVLQALINGTINGTMPDDMPRMQDAGLDKVITDFPERRL